MLERFAHFCLKEETDAIYFDKTIFVLYGKLSFSCSLKNTLHLFSTNELEELGIQEQSNNPSKHLISQKYS